MQSISITRSLILFVLLVTIGCNSNQKKSQGNKSENETVVENKAVASTVENKADTEAPKVSPNAGYAGEYTYSSEEEETFGNVSVRHKKDNIISFELFIEMGGNSGEISGEVEIINGKGIFKSTADGDCILEFVFTNNSVKISHGEGGYGCGFGMNVAVNNTFIKKSEDTSSLTTPVMDKYLITGTSVGEFKIGQEMKLPYKSEIYKIERELRNGVVEGEDYVSVEYHVFEKGKEVMTLFAAHDDPSSNTIYEARILSEDYKTKEGISANSTIEDFMKCYPDYQIYWAYVGNGDYVMYSETIGQNISFILDSEDFISEPKINPDGMTTVKYSDFKKNTKIRYIYIM